jgi:predicted PurR-regulated permease PerM
VRRGVLTDRGLLRAVLLGFALLLAYRFLAAVAATVLLLGTGLLLAVALSAPVEWLHRRKVPRPVAVVGISLLVLGVAGLAGYLLYPVLASQARDLALALPGAVSQLADRAREVANSLGIQIGGGGGISPSTLAQAARRVLGGVLGLFSGLAAFLTGLIVVLFVPLYLAAMPESAVRWVLRLFPPRRRGKAREVLEASYRSLLGWLGGRLFSMFVVGALSTVALYIIGVPGALFLGVLSGLVSFVPILGSIAGALPPLLLALAGNPLDAVWVLLAYVAIQQIESNLLTPLVMRQAISLHPVVLIASVTVAGAAFGVLGALLAVPTAVVAGVLIEHLWFERLENGAPEQPG